MSMKPRLICKCRIGKIHHLGSGTEMFVFEGGRVGRIILAVPRALKERARGHGRGSSCPVTV